MRLSVFSDGASIDFEESTGALSFAGVPVTGEWVAAWDAGLHVRWPKSAARRSFWGAKKDGPQRLSPPGQPLSAAESLTDLRGYELDLEWVTDPRGKWPQKVMYVKRHRDYLEGKYQGHTNGRSVAVLVPVSDAGAETEYRVFLDGLTVGRIPPQDNHRYQTHVAAAANRGCVLACLAWIVTGSDGVFGVRLDLPQSAK